MNQMLSSDVSISDNEELSFPSSVEDHQDSVKFLTRCIIASTSMMIYTRNLLPAENFKKMTVCKLLTRILDPKSVAAGRLLSKLDGVSQALEKGYLREFAILICDDRENTDSAAELYSWQFVYNSGVPIAQFVNSDGECIVSVAYKGISHMKDQLKVLLLKLRNLCSKVMKPVTSNCFVGLRVAYTEKRPDNYCVPGFEPSERMYTLKDGARPVPFRDEGIASPHHGMLLSVSSAFLPRCREEAIYDKIVSSKKNSSTSFDHSSYGGNVFSSMDNSMIAPSPAVVTAPTPISVRRALLFTSSNESVRSAELEMPRLAVLSDSDATFQRQTKDLVDDRRPKVKDTVSNTNTVTSAAAVEDFIDESSLLLDGRTRSSMSSETSNTSGASAGRTNPPKRGRPRAASRVTKEKGESAKKVRRQNTKAAGSRSRDIFEDTTLDSGKKSAKYQSTKGTTPTRRNVRAY